MAVKDSDLFALVEKISEHYQKNINNQYIKKAFSWMNVPHATWDQIETLVGKVEFYRIHGYPLQDLYEQILAAATFVSNVRHDVLPNLRSLTTNLAGNEKTFTDMAVANFPSNLAVFADLVNELYVKATELDRQERGSGTPVFESIPELKKLGDYLIG